MIKGLLVVAISILIAMIVGKIVQKIKLPAILGWLITGMIIGPHAINLFNSTIMDSTWFHIIEGFGEVAIGLIIGTELIWKELKKSGKQIITITITEALGTFAVVSLAFGITFYFAGVPVALAFVFGAIALATAPAPSLAIIKEYNTSGPVTKTLIPLAAIDDMVAVVVFFVVIGIVASGSSGGGMPLWFVPLMIIVPIIIGAIPGVAAGFVLRKPMSKRSTCMVTFMFIIITGALGLGINYLMGKSVFNIMIMGISFSAVFSNMVTLERVHEIMHSVMPIVGVLMVLLILNLGAPLDYNLILGAGLYTAIYIVARAIGKIGGSYTGAVISKAPDTVKKYLGFTLLPHSGVSLMFTAIAVGMLGAQSEEALIVQGTIAAAAVINEIIAVFVAKQGFKLAGEIKSDNEITDGNKEVEENKIS
ncbi:MAG: cation:proton antiporter [Clostridium sp.]|uniref:cation:proton antiporter n=1 Tax=Clostridium sp. TaxID=1506 RepID=UPI003040733A